MTQLISGGARLAERICARGIQSVFSLAGAGHTHLLLPLEDLKVGIVSCRHESGAVGAADGYARVTGGIGIATIIAEQGLPNAISALTTALQLGSPVVVLATRFPNSWVEANGETPVDQHHVVSAVCKWVRTVPSADALCEYFDTACRIATAGTPGPVVLVIPQDFLNTPCRGLPSELPHCPRPAQVCSEEIAQIAARIAQAKRPAILIDSGVLSPNQDLREVRNALTLLNQDLQIPMFDYGLARGLVPEDNHSVLPWPFAQKVLADMDLLIVVGTKLNMWFGFGRAPRFPSHLQTIQIDSNGAAIHRNQAVDYAAVGDPAIALCQLAGVLARQTLANSGANWLVESLAERTAVVATKVASTGPAIHALELIAQLEHQRPGAGVVVGDGADILNWSNALLRIKRPRGYLDHHPLGSMGMGLPLVLGAATAERDIAAQQGRAPQRTTLLTGDGSIGFYLGELDTIAREGLDVTIVIGNDAQWGTEVHGQRLMTQRTVSTKLAWVDYAKIAEGFGFSAQTVTERDTLATAITSAYDGSGPQLVNVHIDPQAGVELKTNPLLSFLIFSDLAPPNH